MLANFIKYISILISLILPYHAFAQDNSADFNEWLYEFKQYAIMQGINENFVHHAFKDVKQPSRDIIKRDRKQPEFVTDYWDYVSKRVSHHRIERGLKMMNEHQALLYQLQQKYDVPSHYLVAFWAVETNFGDYLGDVRAIDALTSLAFDQRRRKFFEQQLISFLKLAMRESLDPTKIMSSWAGAMGHMQFMPSTYYDYAIDGNRDGRIDLWNSLDDAFASAAHYLQQAGWRAGELWGRAVALPRNFDYHHARPKHNQPLSFWRDLGVTTPSGQPLPNSDISAELLLPLGAQGPAFLLYNNFKTIMKWNNSSNYAFSVALLADIFANRGNTALHQKPQNHVSLRFTDVQIVQNFLNKYGYDVGKADGVIGKKTRQAIRQFQQQQNLIVDGYINDQIMQIIRNDTQ